MGGAFERWLLRSRWTKWLPGLRMFLGRSGWHYYNARSLAAPAAQLQAMLPFLDAPDGEVVNLALPAPRFDLVPAGSTKLPLLDRGHPLPLGLPDLREAVAAQFLDANNLEFNPVDELLITQGTSGALGLVLDTFVNPGERVIVFDPGYYGHAWAVEQRQGKLLHVPATADDKGRLRFSLYRLVRAMQRAKLLILNSPQNPTGAVLDPEDLELIAWYADREDILIFSDEVYERYQYDGKFVSLATFAKARGRTLTANSLSKSHAMAAYRVGWLAGPKPLIHACGVTAHLQQHTVPTLCQHLAVEALQTPVTYFQAIRQEFQARRHFVWEHLKALGLASCRPAGTYFAWFPVQQWGLTGFQFADRLLAEHQVQVVPGELFGPGSSGHVRLSYALEDQGKLRKGMQRLAQFIQSLTAAAIPMLPE